MPALDRFVTVDEPFWVDRSRAFAIGLLFSDYECPPLPRDGRSFAGQGWICTFQTAHPGVTTMWGGSLGLLLYYWQNMRPTGIDLATFLQTLSTNPLDPRLIAPVRWPMALSAAIFVSLFYLLLKWLLSVRVALVAALLLALNPFHIALSRVLHQDALTTTFITVSLLSMMGYWLCGWRWRWLLISAICAGLACLSKPVGWFMWPEAAVVGGLGLIYHRQSYKTRWLGGWHLIGEGLVWGLMAGITFFAFFPAMWITPFEILSTILGVSANYSEAGHIDGHYFLGQISRDPGFLFYPITWLWRTSPLELIGLVVLLIQFARHLPYLVKFYLSKPKALYGHVTPPALPITPTKAHLVLLTLALFINLLLLFETLSSKKMDRYFLPAFPAIEIFAALGLLWLTDHLPVLFSYLQARLSFKTFYPSYFFAFSPASRPVLVLVGIILLIQGWLIWTNHPYYFTYYNPLLGGAPVAARLMTIFGWGEGMDQAAAYLNQQPQVESLHIVTAYEDTLKPFFAGQVVSTRDTGEILTADYVVYYHNQLQRRLQNLDTWRYFEGHATPVERITLQGLDYALVYRTPIQQRISAVDNSMPHTYTYGYNLASIGQLTLFWQNLGLGQQIWAGLSPAAGGEMHWLPCHLDPAFAAEADIPGAILETVCDLTAISSMPDLYDLRFGLGSQEAITPIQFPAGRLALTVDRNGQFVSVDQEAALAILTKSALPSGATALDVPLGQAVHLVGYQLEADTWQPGRVAGLWLYWQSTQTLDLAQIADPFQLVLQLTPAYTSEPVLVQAQPLITSEFSAKGLARGAVAPAYYTLALPASLPSTEYSLEVCATLSADGQVLTDAALDSITSLHCLPLFVTMQKL